jgi:hypothetical protein
MQRILDIATYFNEMNNYSGLKEIYAALETSSVRRLQATRTKINLENQRIYKIFIKLFDDHDNGYFERLQKCNPPCVPFIGTHLTIILKTYEFNKIYDDKQKQHISFLQVRSDLRPRKPRFFSSNIFPLKQQAKQNFESLEISSDSESWIQQADDAHRTLSTSDSRSLINFSKYRLLVDFVTNLLQYQYMSYRFHVHDKLRSFITEEIDNYFEKSAAQLNEPMCVSESVCDLLSVNMQMNLVLMQDATNENYMKQNQIQLIENWLYTKSKQIEPEPCKYTHYRRLRKYQLQLPKCSAKPKDPHRSSSTTAYLSQQSTESKLTAQPLASSMQVTKPQKSITSYQRKDAATKPNLNIPVDDTATKPLSGQQPTTSRILSSSTESSTPNTPPPNYDDVFQSQAQNRFDNLNYLRSLQQASKQSFFRGDFATEHHRPVVSSMKNSNTLTSSHSLSSTNLVLYENQAPRLPNIAKISSATDLSHSYKTKDQRRPSYTPPPPPLPPRHSRKITLSSSSSSSSICGSYYRNDPHSLLYPTSQCSNESNSPPVSPKCLWNSPKD